MITSADALAACTARGRSRELCEEAIAAQSVGGVYCDGTIVITAEGKRCVPREVVERVKDARAASPLPELEPEGSSSPWLVGGIVVALVAVVAFLGRD